MPYQPLRRRTSALERTYIDPTLRPFAREAIMRKAVSNDVRKAVNTTATRIAGRVTKVAGRAERAVAQVHQTAGHADTGVIEAIRAQPIVAALAAFALG